MRGESQDSSHSTTTKGTKRPQDDNAELFSRLADEAVSRRKQSRPAPIRTDIPMPEKPVVTQSAVVAGNEIEKLDKSDRRPLSTIAAPNARPVINSIVFNKPRLVKKESDQPKQASQSANIPVKETPVSRPEVTIDYQRDIKPCFDSFNNNDLANILQLPDLPTARPQTPAVSAKTPRRKVSSLRRRFDGPKTTATSSLPSFWRKRRKMTPQDTVATQEMPPEKPKESPYQLPQLQQSMTLSIFDDEQTPKCKHCNHDLPEGSVCSCETRRHSETLERKTQAATSPTKAKIGLFEDLGRREKENKAPPALPKPTSDARAFLDDCGRKLMAVGDSRRVKGALRRLSPHWGRNSWGASTASVWGSRLELEKSHDTSSTLKNTEPSDAGYGTMSSTRSGGRISMSTTDWDGKSCNIRMSQDIAFAPSLNQRS